MSPRKNAVTGNRSGRTRAIRWAAYFFALVILISGCAGGGAHRTSGSERMPEWFFDARAVYPEDRYLSAVGSGDTRAEAERQALAALAQQFSVGIVVDAQTQQRYRHVATATGTVEELELDLVQTVQIDSAQRLLNIRLGEAAVDSLGMVHVIAYIERAPTGRLYADLIRRNSEQTARLMDEMEQSASQLRRYALSGAASALAAGGETLLQQLRIIDPNTASRVVIPFQFDTLNRLHAEQTALVRTAVETRGDDAARVATVVRQEISRRGFPVVNTDTVLHVRTEVRSEPIDVSARIHTIAWEVSSVVQNDRREILLSVASSGTSSGSSATAALAFASRDIDAMITNTFAQRLQEYIDGLVSRQ